VFNPNIDVPKIMGEIQDKAKQKRDAKNELSMAKALNELHPEIEKITGKIDMLSKEITQTYLSAKKHEETALDLRVNPKKFVLLRKATTVFKRFVRKMTRFIWREQNEFNKNINNSIQIIIKTQVELAKSFELISNLIDSVAVINDKVDTGNKRGSNEHSD